jgi:hypothetical protein
MKWETSVECNLTTWRYISGDRTLHVGFEVFTAVVMKSIIFWDMTLCSPQRTTQCHIPEDDTLQNFS